MNNSNGILLALSNVAFQVVDYSRFYDKVNPFTTGRRHFGYCQDLSQVLVGFTLVNLLQFDKSPKGQKGSLSVRLHSVDTQATLSQIVVDFNFTKKAAVGHTASKDYVVELPISYREAQSSVDYRVTITDNRNGETLLDEKLRLIDMSGLNVLEPDETYEIKCGYLKAGATTFRNYYPEKSGAVTIAFEIEHTDPTMDIEQFELQINLYAPLSEVQRRFVVPVSRVRFTKADNWERVCSVEAEFFVDVNERGVYHVELLALGGRIDGFSFTTERTDEGFWEAMDFPSFYVFNRERARAELYQQIAEIDRKRLENAGVQTESPASKKSDVVVGDDDNDDFDCFDEFGDDDFDNAFKRMSLASADGESVDDDSDPEEKRRDEDADFPELESLVGLAEVKRKVESYTTFVRFNKQRRDAELPTSNISLHSLFLGSPGTGKTTVARILGKRLREAGVLSKGHVVVRERSTLLGQNYNSESENTLKALEEARGGILFIDEAYQLYQPQDPKDPGRFVIDSLLTAMSDTRNRDWMLILGGYTEPMTKLMDINPGLRSRIPESNIYQFDDFTSDELLEIATNYFAKNRYSLDTSSISVLRQTIEQGSTHRDASFGNGRYVMNLIETGILPAMAMRVASIENPSVADLSRIDASDIAAATANNLNRAKTHRIIGFNI